LIEHAILSVLERPTVVSAVVGAKRISQMESLIKAVSQSN